MYSEGYGIFILLIANMLATLAGLILMDSVTHIFGSIENQLIWLGAYAVAAFFSLITIYLLLAYKMLHPKKIKDQVPPAKKVGIIAATLVAIIIWYVIGWLEMMRIYRVVGIIIIPAFVYSVTVTGLEKLDQKIERFFNQELKQLHSSDSPGSHQNK
jgi:predicted PurR-regulated permease PerM